MRSSGRIPKEIPILLIGSDLDGRVFSEHTVTVLLSLHGAGIVSAHKLSPEQELVLRLPDLNKEAEIRVVGQIGSQNGNYTYGVAFFDPHLNFWGLDFPPISLLETELGLLSLVCNSCKALEKVDDTGIEADVCATNEGVIRYCKRCGTSTLWKPSLNATNQEFVSSAPDQISAASAISIPAPAVSPALPPTPPASFYAQSQHFAQDAAPSPSTVYPAAESRTEPRAAVLTMSPPAPEKPSAPRANRRKHPRVKVTYSACIRHPERGDDLVTCEDMSKGGVRFKSRKSYYAQSLIEVAVPYEQGQPAIFVPAQIVFVEELPEQRLFRYGVQYIKATKSRDYF